ncbi:MAG: hypothetical protein IPI85_09715 [Dehalococcoidia bacterium]|nr:hypothetical protein [Dehalococcoidia bacterium]
MTLALYGKSRKRQGGLIFSAFMAIMVAAIGGVAMIGTALAHHATITGTVTCQANGSYTVNWKVENSQSDKVMWVATQTNPAVGATAAISPSPITKNTDGGGPATARPRNGILAGTPASLWRRRYWTTKPMGLVRKPSGSGTQSYSETINPSAVCDGKIIIKKYVPDGDNTTTVFSADVQNTTTNTQVANDTTFSEAGAPGDREIVIAGANNTNLTVTENALSGYQLTGVAVRTVMSIATATSPSARLAQLPFLTWTQVRPRRSASRTNPAPGSSSRRWCLAPVRAQRTTSLPPLTTTKTVPARQAG